MRKEMFEAEIARVWGAHYDAIDGIFQRSKVMTEPVQVRLEYLNAALTQAIGGRVGFFWGPARYDLAAEKLFVTYRITSEDLDRTFETTIDYGPDGVVLEGRGFAYDEVDRLLVLLTQLVWETFQPPAVRDLEIYPQRKE